MDIKKSGLDKQLLLDMYGTMKRARKFDERINLLNRAGKVGFNISGMGHEAAEVGCAYAFNTEIDYLAPYYRDLALMMAWGVSFQDLMLSYFGRGEDPSSGGRQMPAHWGNKDHRVLTTSSPVTTQYLHAVGVAYAAKLAKDPIVVYTATGHGSSNQGDFHEAINFASVHNLPVIFVIYNNKFAISTGPELQYHAKHLADRGLGYGIPGVNVDGLDLVACYKASKEAVDRARRGEGPTLLEFDVVRFTAHSTDDDHSIYRDMKKLEEDKKLHDPVILIEQALLKAKYIDEDYIKALEKEIKKELDQATKYAENAPFAAPEDALLHVYED